MDKEIIDRVEEMQGKKVQEFKKMVDSINSLKDSIGEEKWNEIVAEACVDADRELMELLGQEKWQIFLACSRDSELKEKIINDIGKEKFNELRDEVNKIVEEHLNSKR